MGRAFLVLIVILILSGVSSAVAEKNLVLGAIIPDSGDDRTLGPGIEAAIDLATSDLNDSYAKAGMDTRVTVLKAKVNGTKESTATATKDLIAQGAKILVGPSSSEEVSGVLPILRNESIISISPTSSLALSLPGDPVIRLCPDDSHLLQAVALYESSLPDAQSMKAVILARKDLYGDVLANAIKRCPFVVDQVSYEPGTRNFTATLDELNAKVTPLLDATGDQKVVVFAIGFDELADLMAQASAYPNLLKTRWQGMDSVALNAAIINNKTAAEFANSTGLIALQFNIDQPADSEYWRVYQAIVTATGDYKPSIYEILPYDQTLLSAWILQNNPSSLNESLYLADNYGKYSYSATGWLKLNDNGDRKYGDYFFYQVVKTDNDSFTWVPTLVYRSDTNTILPLESVNNTFMQNYR